MRQPVQVLLALGLVSLTTTSVAEASSRSIQPYIVRFNSTVADPGAVAGQLGAKLGFTPRFVYRYALKGFAAPLSSAAVSAIQSDSRVSYIEADSPLAATACPY